MRHAFQCLFEDGVHKLCDGVGPAPQSQHRKRMAHLKQYIYYQYITDSICEEKRVVCRLIQFTQPKNTKTPCSLQTKVFL